MPSRSLVAVLSALVCALWLAPVASADRSFAQRYSYGGTGDVLQIGNTLLTCTTSATNCETARAGTGGTLNNNSFTMANVDADSDPSTTNSSSATLTVPAGATVRFAGLYYGGRSTTSAANRAAVSFRVPGASSYAQLTGAVDTSVSANGSADALFYQGFVDVTTQVRTAGSGAYWVGNVEADLAADRSAGWSLVVVYSLATETRRQLYVYDGLRQVNSTVGSVEITLDDLATPPTGIVDGRIGIVSNEGDLGITGDKLFVGSEQLSDTLNPLENPFNSTIGNAGTRSTAKTPDYINQLGWDVDTLALPAAAIPAGSTSTKLTLSSTQDAYLPGVVTLTSKAETDPPETTLDPVPAAINDPTPTFTFSSSETRSTFECRVDDADFAACTSGFTAPALGDGTHTFEVRGIDRVGNVDPTPAGATFTVDTVAPDTTIDSGPANGSFITDATPTLRFSSNEAGATFRCTIDGGAPTPCTSPLEPTLADGGHTIVVYAVDAAGNDDSVSPARRSFTVDTVAPDTTITGPADGSATNDTTPDVTFTSNESGATFECAVDGAAYATCSSPLPIGPLGQGSHTVEVRAIDRAGTVDPSPARTTFTVDTAAPDTTITGPADGSATNDTTPEITFTSTEPGGTFQCSVDGAAYATCTSPFSTATLAQGVHTVAVRAVDAAGNRDASPAAISFTVDTTAPTARIDEGPTGTTTDPRPVFRISGDEAGVTLRCSLDSTTLTACPNPLVPATDLPDGSHTFRVQAVDRAGNVSTVVSRTFVVDATPPDTTIDSGPADGTTTADPTPTFGFSSEAGARFECSVDGAAYATCTSQTTTATLPDGTHTFRVRAIDAAGNPDPTPAARTIRVDTTAPETTIDVGPANGTTVGTSRPTFEFSSNERDAAFRCSIDGGPVEPCSSPLTTDALADGPHTFRVYAVDLAGNVDDTPSRRSFVVDTVAPETLGTGPSGTIGTARPDLIFVSPDLGASFECRVDAGAWASCASPHSSDALADGPHVVEVRAVDPAGNGDATPVRFEFVVETGPAQTTVDGPRGTIETRTATFQLGSDESAATFECALDGGAFEACTSPWTTPELADGEHTLLVRSVDSAGNRDETPASITWTVAVPVPATAAETAPAAAVPAPAAAAEPAPTGTADDEDLGTLAGSLVGANRCQLLAGPGFVKQRQPRGVGKLLLRMRSNATSPPGTPLVLTLARTTPRLRSVAYRLDGRPVRSARRAPYTLRLTPARLATRKRHTLQATFTARNGKTTSYRFRFRTLRCSAMLSLSQTRLRRGNLLRLRVDSVRALSTVAVRLPAATLRRATARGALLLRLRSAGSRTRAYRYTVRRGVAVGPRSAPTVRITRAGVTIGRLPARAGIVRLDVRTLAPALGGTRGTLVRGTATAGGRAVRLATRTRAPASRR